MISTSSFSRFKQLPLWLKSGLIFVMVGLGYGIFILGLIISSSFNRPLTKSDAVMVLGARVYLKGHPNPCLLARLNEAANIYHQGLSQYILVTGGTDKEDNTNEATFMATTLQQLGVPNEVILLEKHSTSTFENMQFSLALLVEKSIKNVIVVSDAQHLWRAGHYAKTMLHNMDIQTQRPTQSQCWQMNVRSARALIREPIAITHNIAIGQLPFSSLFTP